MNFKIFMDGIEVTKKKTTRKKKEIDIFEITECLID